MVISQNHITLLERVFRLPLWSASPLYHNPAAILQLCGSWGVVAVVTPHPENGRYLLFVDCSQLNVKTAVTMVNGYR